MTTSELKRIIRECIREELSISLPKIIRSVLSESKINNSLYEERNSINENLRMPDFKKRINEDDSQTYDLRDVIKETFMEMKKDPSLYNYFSVDNDRMNK
ncbi:MAG: hypothetical protein IRZ03_15680 [Acidobacterium ailaaui]|nr:hypothetical protein [Pseudacidobacterium ailaaui]